MRIILAGSKGNIGTAILLHALKIPGLTHIYALSRAPSDTPPASSSISRPHSKVTEITLTDSEFAQWPAELIQQFAKVGVRACIWCIGGWPSSFPNTEAAERANIDLPLEAAMALSRSLALDKPFRFVYLSATGAEQNPNVTLWTQAQFRKMKGAAEVKLAEVQAAVEHERGRGLFEVFCLRLGTVLAGGKTAANIIKEGMYTSVNMERLCLVCCEVAMNGWFEDEGGKRGGGVIENAEILGPDWAEVNKLPAFS